MPLWISSDPALWLKPTILLCSYGFFLYIKPSEPFLTPYLQGDIHNLTEEEVVNEIYPVWIYSYMAVLVPVFLLTDYLRYKPVIIFQCLGNIACWLLLLFGRGVPLMQLMQFFYAVATAGEIGYYSYIYSIVDESHYQRVTSYVRSMTLFGQFTGSLLGQLLVSLAGLDYFYLNVISLVDVSIAFLISLFLPMPKTSLFFSNIKNPSNMNRNESHDLLEDDKPKVSDSQENLETKVSWQTSLSLLWSDLVKTYKNLTLLRWSIWWALSTCGWLLVVNYVQNLWETIRPSSHNEVYNGAVECLATVLGALGAVLVGFIKFDLSRYGELALGVFSIIKCGLLMGMYFTDNIWLCYSVYVAFIFVYNLVITITQFQIAIGLSTPRFALVFGVNMFVAVALNSLLTVILIDKAGLKLDVNTQFIIYSGYFGLVALIFLSHAFYVLHQQRKNSGQVVVKTAL